MSKVLFEEKNQGYSFFMVNRGDPDSAPIKKVFNIFSTWLILIMRDRTVDTVPSADFPGKKKLPVKFQNSY